MHITCHVVDEPKLLQSPFTPEAPSGHITSAHVKRAHCRDKTSKKSADAHACQSPCPCMTRLGSKCSLHHQQQTRWLSGGFIPPLSKSFPNVKDTNVCKWMMSSMLRSWKLAPRTRLQHDPQVPPHPPDIELHTGLINGPDLKLARV